MLTRGRDGPYRDAAAMWSQEGTMREKNVNGAKFSMLALEDGRMEVPR